MSTASERLAVRRRAEVAAGIDDTLLLLRSSHASPTVRAAQAEDHMRVVVARLEQIDAELFAGQYAAMAS